MINWFFLALFGHLSNAGSFIVDKFLLKVAFKRSATYAAVIGILSLIVFLLVPWVKVWPTAALYPYIIAFGGLFVLAVMLFFEALKRAETSRVVPIVGSLIPVFTLIGAVLFLGERLTVAEYAGFVLLFCATWILTGGGLRARMEPQVLLWSLGAAVLFAASSIFGKYAFLRGDFVAVLIGSRVAVAVVGCGIALALPSSRAELMTLFHPKRGLQQSMGSWTLMILGQAAGAAGFVLVALALAKGSAALVNALQAVQYAAIILVAWIGGKHVQKALGEEITPRSLVAKSIAIVFVAAGLSLLF